MKLVSALIVFQSIPARFNKQTLHQIDEHSLGPWTSLRAQRGNPERQAPAMAARGPGLPRRCAPRNDHSWLNRVDAYPVQSDQKCARSHEATKNSVTLGAFVSSCEIFPAVWPFLMESGTVGGFECLGPSTGSARTEMVVIGPFPEFPPSRSS